MASAWKRPLEGIDALAVGEGVVVAVGAWELYALDARTGDVRWVVPELTSSGGSWAEVADGKVNYFAEEEAVFDLATGERLGEPQTPADKRFNSGLTVNGFTVRVSDEGATIQGPDSATWTIPVEEEVADPAGQVVADGTWVYFALGDGAVYGIDLGDPDVDESVRSVIG